MKRLKVLLGLLAAFLTCGCGPQPVTPTTGDQHGTTKPSDDKKPDDDDHDHGDGPNGGPIFDLGKHHAEFTADHAKKKCYVLFIRGMDSDAKPLPVACKELTLTTKPTAVKDGTNKGMAVPAMTITLKPVDEKDGKASKFVGSDPGLANVAGVAGTVTGVIGGKPSSGKFKQ